MNTDFDTLNSATQYPSIETYHKLDGGRLTEEPNFAFEGDVILTEKIDGTNGRVVVMPDGDFFIGSRKEILYAKGDRRIDPAQSIVQTLLPLAQAMVHEARRTVGDDRITVFFGEVYGGKIGPAAKQYTSAFRIGFRLFDIAFVPTEALSWSRERIASWRDGGGQTFADETALHRMSDRVGVSLTPRRATVSAEALPTTLTGMNAWLTNAYAVHSMAMLDGEDTPGSSEGVVLRTRDRSVIAKARLSDYAKALRPAGKHH